MSNKTSKDGTLQLTKQMLDELDALMERMLSLPVNEPDDAPPFPKEVVKAPTLAVTMSRLEAPAPLSPSPLLAEPVPPLHPAYNSPHIMPPAPNSIAPAPVVETLAPVPLTNDVVPASLLPALEPFLTKIRDEPAPALTLWCYWPLLWINQSFDQLVGLRSQGTRLLLGMLGLALLLASAGWFFKDWLGWNW